MLSPTFTYFHFFTFETVKGKNGIEMHALMVRWCAATQSFIEQLLKNIEAQVFWVWK